MGGLFFQFFQRCGKGEQMRCLLISLISEQQGIRKGGGPDFRLRTDEDEDEDGRTEVDCIVLYCIVLWYCMVLHCTIVSYGARTLSCKTSIFLKRYFGQGDN